MAFIEYPQGSKRQSSIFIPGTSLNIPDFWREINHFNLLAVLKEIACYIYKPLLLDKLSQCCTCKKYSLLQDQDHSSGSLWSGHNHDTPFQSHIFKGHSNKPWWSFLWFPCPYLSRGLSVYMYQQSLFMVPMQYAAPSLKNLSKVLTSFSKLLCWLLCRRGRLKFFRE